MIKAIETVYNGYRFRSRLEARWAVFFDKAGIPYEYEKEGFDLDGKRYLPDFWLPEQECWIEIKGQEPTENELNLTLMLAEYHFNSVHIFYGDIEIPSPGHFYEKVISHLVYPDYSIGKTPYVSESMKGETGWSQCPWCLSLNITYHSDIRGLHCGCHKYIEQHIKLEPLQTLLKHCPDLATKEPKRNVRSQFFNLGITEWWQNKINTLTYTGDSPRLITAYTAARQARFEHGEKP